MHNSVLSQEDARLIGSAREATSEAIMLSLPFSDENHQGAFFSLKKFGYGWLIARMIIGYVPIEKLEKYGRFSMEKPERIESHLPEIHYSSFQSRNPELDQWGGGILGFENENPSFGYGCSGLFPEHCDEAVCLLVALKLGHLNIAQACYIAGISQNEIFMKIRSKIQLDSQNYFHQVRKI